MHMGVTRSTSLSMRMRVSTSAFTGDGAFWPCSRRMRFMIDTTDCKHKPGMIMRTTCAARSTKGMRGEGCRRAPYRSSRFVDYLHEVGDG